VRGIVEQNHIGGAVVVRKDEINAAASAAHVKPKQEAVQSLARLSLLLF
jgi:hypothetical protein